MTVPGRVPAHWKPNVAQTAHPAEFRKDVRRDPAVGAGGKKERPKRSRNSDFQRAKR